jgi:hypothetical protein
MPRLVIETHELFRAERERSVGLAQVIAKLNFPNVRRQCFYNRPDLATAQTRCGYVLKQSHYRKQVDFSHNRTLIQ